VVSADDVIELVDALEGAGVAFWIDGGWGIDALLGTQHRPHDDLDAAISRDDLPRAEAALAPLGFARDESQAEWFPARFVLRDARGRRFDLHPLRFEADGTGIQEMPAWHDAPEGMYPAEGLQGSGTIAGRAVRCLTPELQLAHHRYPDPDDVDYDDVQALCQRFGLALPSEYGRRPGWIDGRRSSGHHSVSDTDPPGADVTPRDP
jgi:lincosamide nucleotidyltransferase A/C/D/E